MARARIAELAKYMVRMRNFDHFLGIIVRRPSTPNKLILNLFWPLRRKITALNALQENNVALCPLEKTSS
jgi:hypothetical protein